MTDELFQEYIENFRREQRAKLNEINEKLEAYLRSILAVDLTAEIVQRVQNLCEQVDAQTEAARRSVVDSVNELEREYRKRKRE